MAARGDINAIRISHLGIPGAWIGALRRGTEVIWKCPHAHGNRDQSTQSNSAARECAGYVHEAVTDRAKAERVLKSLREWHPSHIANVDVSRQHQRAIALREWALSVADELSLEASKSP